MEANDCMPAQGGPAAEAPPSGDWRSDLPPGCRPMMVNKMFECCRRHFPTILPESLDEIMRITVQFEEFVYATSTSETDYVRRIAVTLLALEKTPAPQPSLAGLFSQLRINGDSEKRFQDNNAA